MTELWIVKSYTKSGDPILSNPVPWGIMQKLLNEWSNKGSTYFEVKKDV